MKEKEIIRTPERQRILEEELKKEGLINEEILKLSQELKSMKNRLIKIGSSLSVIFMIYSALIVAISFLWLLFDPTAPSPIINLYITKKQFGLFTIISLISGIVLFVMETFLVMRYRNLKKFGDILFEELSDELEWNSKEGKNKIPIEIRMNMKNYILGYKLFPFKKEEYFFYVFAILLAINGLAVKSPF